ncbi:hypothetical protein M9H77_18356 [Catharanthus roseus]|uniref:Uncharacterized protein n=1 Tax=Catharanthus roseus TaxID=4058 RepID=A0ACC0B795_CATRO|nr:hypothetical protein M9H77_18356 [Catharanthus roseus]
MRTRQCICLSFSATTEFIIYPQRIDVARTRNSDWRFNHYSRPTLIEYLRTALIACALSTNLIPNCMSVMELFQSSNRTVPDSTRSSIGEPEPISRNVPECV